MRPPICAICHRKTLSFGINLIKFSYTPEEEKQLQEWEKLNQNSPPGWGPYYWFCIFHTRIARKYKHLTWKEAENKIYFKILRNRIMWICVIIFVLALYFTGNLK